MIEENNNIDDLLGDIKGDIEKKDSSNSNIKNYESKNVVNLLKLF